MVGFSHTRWYDTIPGDMSDRGNRTKDFLMQLFVYAKNIFQFCIEILKLRLMKKTALLFACFAAGIAAQAQISLTGSTLNYSQDFNTLSNSSTASGALPSGWNIFEFPGVTGSSANIDQMYKGDVGTNNAGDTYSFGAASTTERALGALGSNTITTHFGAKFINNTGSQITGFSISYKGEQWRFGFANRIGNADSLRFYYSTTASNVDDTLAAWTEVTSLMFNSPVISGGSATALDGNINSSVISGNISVNVAPGSILVIKWVDKNIIGGEDGMAIDDVSMTFTTSTPPPPNYTPHIIGMIPADNSTNLPAGSTDLKLIFDRKVSKGSSGTFRVRNETDQTTAILAISSPSISLNGGTLGDTVTISGVSLALAKTYHVTFDSTAFDTAGYRSAGIYDTTAWNFSTSTPPPPPLISLNEQFDAACNAGTLPLGWMRENIGGPGQQWICAGTSGADRYMQMNGFVGGGSNDNEDWLITPLLDLQSMLNPTLTFKAFKGFTGSNIEVLTSNNYSGGDPNAANWNSLNISFTNATSSWSNYSSALGAAAGQPLHIAFRYECSQAGNNCAQWRVDSVLVNGTTSILSLHSNNQMPVSILGTATTNNIPVGYIADEASAAVVSIYDLTGRMVYSQSQSAVKGMNVITLSPAALVSGIYIVRVACGDNYGVVKAVVE